MEIPTAFAARKREITAALAAPEAEYHDRSPKGSVDTDIQDLITLLNGLDGIVTTSSCAGRVSLFVEGTGAAKYSKNSAGAAAAPVHASGSSTDDVAVAGDPDAVRHRGLGGGWLFVTHSADELDQLPARIRDLDRPPPSTRPTEQQQAQEILHILAASLAHAQPILSAAFMAGWRESGINSLRCLDAPKTAFPVVGVRSAGLALGGVVGYVSPDDGRAVFLVDTHYIEFMTERFRAQFGLNRRRIERFEENVRRIGVSSPRQILRAKKREAKQARVPRETTDITQSHRRMKGDDVHGNDNNDDDDDQDAVEEIYDGLQMFGV